MADDYIKGVPLADLPETTALNDSDIMVVQNEEKTQKVTVEMLSKKIAGNITKELFLLSHPIGSIYISVSSENPGNTYGGTWVAWGSGRVLVGVNAAETEFNTVEKEGGEKTHVLTVAQMPSHNHGFSANTSTNGNHQHSFDAISNTVQKGTSYNRPFSYGSGDVTGGYKTNTTGNHYHTVSGTTAAQGSGQAFNVMQPYITCYMWKRTE